MDQISPPIRILLAGAVLMMAAWFTVLKPGAEPPVEPTPAAAAPAAPTTAYGKAVANAESAAAATNARTAAVEGAPATTGSVPATTANAGKPAASATKVDADAASAALPASVAKAVAQKKVLVMLFWNKNAIDDRAVRRELRGIDRKNGKVVVHVASIADVARYAPITRGVNLEQSPTVVVSKGATADALVGYVDSKTIDQAVSDLLRAR